MRPVHASCGRALWRHELKEGKEIALRETGDGGGLRLRENRIGKISLLTEHFVNPLLNCIHREKSGDGDGPHGTDAMGAVDCLIFDRWIPPSVKEKDVLRKLQVEPDGTGAVGEQQNRVPRIVFESLNCFVAGRSRHAAVVFQRTKPGQLATQTPDRFNPLAKYE